MDEEASFEVVEKIFCDKAMEWSKGIANVITKFW